MSLLTSRAASELRRNANWILIAFAILMLSLHWIHLLADPNWRLGFATGKNWATDFTTDEGWEANAAIQAALTGHWHMPGEVSLAVESPVWPIILYLPFKVFGLTIFIPRAIAVSLFSASVLTIFFFVRRLSNLRDAGFTAALLSVNVLAFSFSRVGFIEPIFVALLVLAIVAALEAVDRDSLVLSALAGLILSLALLCKLTALFGIVPIIAICWLRSSGSKQRLRFLAASSVSLVTILSIHHFFLTALYPDEHKIYLFQNLDARRVHGAMQWLLAIARVLRGMRAVGPFLVVAFVLGFFGLLFYRKRLVRDPLIIIGCSWLLANIAIFSTLSYFPPRYCFSLLFPVTILAVRFASLDAEVSPRLGSMLYAALLGSLLFDSIQDLRTVAHPQYTMLQLAREVRLNLTKKSETPCTMIGSITNTLSLYNGLHSNGYMLGWSLVPESNVIKGCDPQVFLERGALTLEDQQNFSAAGKALLLQEKIPEIPGEGGDGLVYVYRIQSLQ